MQASCLHGEMAWTYCRDPETLPQRLDECRKMCALAETHTGAAQMGNARFVCRSVHR